MTFDVLQLRSKSSVQVSKVKVKVTAWKVVWSPNYRFFWKSGSLNIIAMSEFWL